MSVVVTRLLITCIKPQLFTLKFLNKHRAFKKSKLNAPLILANINSPIQKLGLGFGGTFLRVSYLAFVFTPLIIVFPFYYLTYNESRMWFVHWLVWTLEKSGPTFTKLGQWASSRSDLFPENVCRVLSKLQADVEPHSMYHTRKLFFRQFGCQLEDIFERFDPNPVGVGAVAQVYKARLKGDHIDVAVKVLHPKARSLVNTDLKIMKTVANIIERITPQANWLSLPDEVDIFSFMMKQQLDLRQEANHLIKFQNNFKAWSLIGFPKPVLEFSTEDVLVETWIKGVPLEKFLRLRSCFDKKIATIGLTSFLKMLLLDNHVHADLHPGNILISYQKIPASYRDAIQFIPDDILEEVNSISDPLDWKLMQEELFDNDYVPFLYYVDAGLTSSLSPLNLTNFIDLFKAVTDYNGIEISKLMVSRSKLPDSVIDMALFTSKMKEFMDGIKFSTLALGKVQISDILSFMMSAVRKHHIKIDGDFVNVVISIFLLEGIGRQLDPDVDLIKAAVPFLTEAIQTRILKGDISNTESSILKLIEKEMTLKIYKRGLL